MSWDALQLEALDALGHHVYVQQTSACGVADAAPAVQGGDALLHALLRAAGRDATAPDAAALAGQWSPLERLHTPAAKRALWPRLRALRKDAGGRGGG